MEVTLYEIYTELCALTAHQPKAKSVAKPKPLVEPLLVEEVTKRYHVMLEDCDNDNASDVEAVFMWEDEEEPVENYYQTVGLDIKVPEVESESSAGKDKDDKAKRKRKELINLGELGTEEDVCQGEKDQEAAELKAKAKKDLLT
jgi:hypothetical protein